MPRVRNAFKIRAADPPLIDTSQFLQLYCPVLLEQFDEEKLFSDRLLVIRGSPGAGKSSFLRLFEASALVAIHTNRDQGSTEDLVQALEKLRALTSDGPKALGLYIHCDGALRDVAHVGTGDKSPFLFNALLDVRITRLFLTALRQLQDARVLSLGPGFQLSALDASDVVPELFSKRLTLDEMAERCQIIERGFSAALNSFPDDPLPAEIRGHSRLHALSYLERQVRDVPALNNLRPVVMLDDVQDLYPDQRLHLRKELVRRSPIARWLAVRTHVYGLEEVISFQAGDGERGDSQEIDLDGALAQSSLFARFAANIVDRRLRATQFLEAAKLTDFKGYFQELEENLPASSVARVLGNMADEGADLRAGRGVLAKIDNALKVVNESPLNFAQLVELQQMLIGARRLSKRAQLPLFPDMEFPQPPDAKTEEAALLFVSKALRVPYYKGFDKFVGASSANVHQLLSNLAPVVDLLVHRAELDQALRISAKEQDAILRKRADDYYNSLVSHHRHGAAILQFVRNLGRFCAAVTYRPNAPIAPGVTGFGINRAQLSSDKARLDPIKTQVLTEAVAGNILTVRTIRQGTAGAENEVFYLNRLLCVKFDLPLNYGGWQHVSLSLLDRMMEKQLSTSEMSNGSRSFHWSEEGSAE